MSFFVKFDQIHPYPACLLVLLLFLCNHCACSSMDMGNSTHYERISHSSSSSLSLSFFLFVFFPPSPFVFFSTISQIHNSPMTLSMPDETSRQEDVHHQIDYVDLSPPPPSPLRLVRYSSENLRSLIKKDLLPSPRFTTLLLACLRRTSKY